MARLFSISAVVAALMASAASSAYAQEAAPAGQDWVLAEVPERKAVVAMAEFDNGISLASRCMDGVFEVTLHGLPEVRGPSRTLQIAVGEEEPYDTAWTVGQVRTAAFSRVPARFARELAKGGRLQIRVPGQRGAPATRYIMELDPSGSAIEQTLTACGRSMVDLRYQSLGDEIEAGLPAGITWSSPPQVEFPSAVKGRVPTVGFVTVTCVARSTGSVEQCEVESEHPGGYKMGQSVVQAALRARLRSTERNVPIPDRRTIMFTTHFRLQ